MLRLWLCTVLALGLGDDEVHMAIGPIEVEAAQKVWGSGILRLRQLYAESPKAAKKEAATFVTQMYGHGLKPVIVKPVNSTSKPFRTTKDGVISSLVGGYEEFPEDKGFVVGQFWDKIRFDNAGISVEGPQALAMGNCFFRDPVTGNESALEYTFGYFRDKEGHLRINLHFASAPYQNHSNRTVSEDITSEELNAAQKSFGDTIVDIGKYYKKGWSYKEHALMFVDRMFAYDLGPVLFKPAEAKKHPFRLDREGALAYYRGMDENYPEDTGFALRPWVRYDLENSAVILQEKTAFAMGNYLFEDADGGTTEAQYTFGYVKDEEGALRIHVFMASIPADGEDLKFAQEPGEANLTEMTMEAAQLTWAKKLVEVGNRYVMKGDYHEVAEELVDECYAFSLRPTLFKPAEARLSPFRTSRAGAVSYFAGGDKNFPEDWGFALRPWESARLSTEAAVIHGTQGLVMGHAYFDDALGIQRKAEFAMGFVKSSQGVRINLHHTHFPNYTEIRRMQQAPPRALEQYQVLEAQKEWGNGIVELGKYGRKVLELEERDEVEHFVGVHQEHDVNRSVLWRRAADFVDKLYAFTEGPVMLKVTEASPGTRFRTTRLGAVSWLIGGNPDFPADRGFALRPWNQVRFDNAKISIRGDKAQAIGSIALLDDPGNERQLEYVFCYARDLDGRLRIEVAHLALPYGASYRSMWDNIAGEATGAAGAVKYAAKGVAGAVHGAVGLASQGGTGLWVLLASVGVTAAFVYYFVCAWGAKPGASQGSFMSNAGAFPSYPPQGWPAGDGFGQSQMGQMASMGGSGYRASAGRTSYAQAGGLGFQGSSSYAYGNLPQRDQQVHSLKYLS